MSRKLLSSSEVAAKLGRSYHWFMKKENRAELYAQGFPRPVLGAGPQERAAYDPAAIDAWLDNKMDPALRSSKAETARGVGNAAINWEHIVAQRAQAAA